MLTFLRSSSPVLVMISSMSVPICNHFHVRRANSGRITPFKWGCPCFSSRSWGPLSRSGIKFCHKILESLSYHTVKTKSFHLTWAPIGSGLWRTPRHQDRITIANTRSMLALTRKNSKTVTWLIVGLYRRQKNFYWHDLPFAVFFMGCKAYDFF